MGVDSVTSLTTSEDHYLVSAGGAKGIVECWDPRARSCIGFVQMKPDENGAHRAVTKLNYISGLKIAAGTEDGRVVVYDLRQTRPLVTKELLDLF